MIFNMCFQNDNTIIEFYFILFVVTLVAMIFPYSYSVTGTITDRRLFFAIHYMMNISKQNGLQNPAMLSAFNFEKIILKISVICMHYEIEAKM